MRGRGVGGRADWNVLIEACRKGNAVRAFRKPGHALRQNERWRIIIWIEPYGWRGKFNMQIARHYASFILAGATGRTKSQVDSRFVAGREGTGGKTIRRWAEGRRGARWVIKRGGGKEGEAQWDGPVEIRGRVEAKRDVLSSFAYLLHYFEEHEGTPYIWPSEVHYPFPTSPPRRFSKRRRNDYALSLWSGPVVETNYGRRGLRSDEKNRRGPMLLNVLGAARKGIVGSSSVDDRALFKFFNLIRGVNVTTRQSRVRVQPPVGND